MNSAQNPFFHDLPKQKVTIGKSVIDFLQIIVVFLAVFVIFYLFLVIPNQVDGQSMEPNFHNRELLFTNKVIQLVGTTDLAKKYNYDYRRGDVVIFQKPDHPDFIKRVIGLPGERVMIKDGWVYINGKQLVETYLAPGQKSRTYSFIFEGEEKTIPEGSYFLMGDNRDNSKDSRFTDIGFVERKYIKGRVFVRYWPPEKAQFIEQGEIIMK